MFAYGPADATASKNPIIYASFKSRLVLPFWYWLTQVVLEKRPLNGCSSSSSSSSRRRRRHHKEHTCSKTLLQQNPQFSSGGDVIAIKWLHVLLLVLQLYNDAEMYCLLSVYV